MLLLYQNRVRIGGPLPNIFCKQIESKHYAVTYDIIQNSIPLEGTYKDATIRKMAVLEVDFEANKKFLQET